MFQLVQNQMTKKDTSYTSTWSTTAQLQKYHTSHEAKKLHSCKLFCAQKDNVKSNTIWSPFNWHQRNNNVKEI
jgi:hypothetical protein